uniref:DNA topoisomerase I catalytic core eukaryotic-type domain-containing protein n=1 Tax=viral metagenome TaxID=1070528 RepID=A0A6C0KCK3_9ZZZZ
MGREPIHIRVARVEKVVPMLKRMVDQGFASCDASRKRLAATVCVLLATGCRPGTQANVGKHSTYGLTTVTFDHIRTKNVCVFLSYIGKKSVQQSHRVCNPQLVAWIRGITPPARPFVTAEALRKAFAPLGIRPKDVRTWKANQVFRANRARGASETDALLATAACLGNTARITRTAYVAPGLLGRKPSATARHPAKKS